MKHLQKGLNEVVLDKPNLNVDGIFGPKTEDHVVGYQRALHRLDSGIIVDGVAGPETWHGMGVC